MYTYTDWAYPRPDGGCPLDVALRRQSRPGLLILTLMLKLLLILILITLLLMILLLIILLLMMLLLIIVILGLVPGLLTLAASASATDRYTIFKYISSMNNALTIFQQELIY